MILDARDLPPSKREIDADLCIVGAGPAGLVVCAELASSGARIVMLEGGAANHDPWNQELNAGHVNGTSYGDLRTTRARAIGGTATIWNSEIDGQAAAKYVPLDARDFLAREWLPYSGWPFGAEELRPWYEKAQTICGLGRFEYGAQGWSTSSAKPLSLDPGRLETKVYQFGSAARLLEAPLGHLQASEHVDLYVHATVVEFITGPRNRRVNAVTFMVRGREAPVRVNAHTFVLAAGGIENARLLLDSHAGYPGGLGNEHGHVGRFFMEHPRDYALTLIPARKTFLEEATFYDQHGAADGTVIMGRLALNDAQSLQASATLLPIVPKDSLLARASRRIRGALGSASPRNADYPRSAATWSRRRSPYRRGPNVRLLLNLEQAPNPDNRVALADEKDAFDRRRVVLHWRWSDAEQRNLERLRMLFVESLEAAGYGTVQIQKDLRPDPNAHHHAGTTRMHIDDRFGVVDAHSRVHSLENLYVTGSSVFPTAGFANPTLTIVALAARLAARLRQLAEQSATVCQPASRP